MIDRKQNYENWKTRRPAHWYIKETNEKNEQPNGYSFSLAPPTGLEPVTSWLTVMRSTDWAMEEYRYIVFSCLY